MPHPLCGALESESPPSPPPFGFPALATAAVHRLHHTSTRPPGCSPAPVLPVFVEAQLPQERGTPIYERRGHPRPVNKKKKNLVLLLTRAVSGSFIAESVLDEKKKRLFPDLAEFKFVSRLFLKTVLLFSGKDRLLTSTLRLNSPVTFSGQKIKLAASWLFDHLAQVMGEPCPPSNELSSKYLQPVPHAIIPHPYTILDQSF
ncbi:hypothetical protein CRENBAI_012109 [Crenichthys baileyi]|uniref:Uncharacterized protein n=1 Tax=Crenichthys baileyi TaxID=28760 RepID=A0AAV9S7I1_9TELE